LFCKTSEPVSPLTVPPMVYVTGAGVDAGAAGPPPPPPHAPSAAAVTVITSSFCHLLNIVSREKLVPILVIFFVPWLLQKMSLYSPES
jgi:hypothetical protein